MKKTQQKDAIRNIRKQLVSFLSIVIVIALGVGIFLTCLFSSEALSRKGSAFYRQTAWHDLEVRSTNGITAEDVAAVREAEGIADAEGVFTLDMLMEAGEDRSIVHVVTRTENTDKYIVLEGRDPQDASECAVVAELAEKYGLSVGDEINIRGKTQQQDFLNRGSFVIAGIIRHPDHFRHEVETTYNVVITPEAVDTEKMGVPFTGILVRFDTKSRNVFSAEYEKEANRAADRLDVLGEERAQIRFEELKADAARQIEDGEKQLADGLAQLDGIREQVAELEKKLEDPQITFLETVVYNAQLVTLNAQLTAGTGAYNDGLKKLEAGKAQAEALEPGRWIVLPRSLNLTWSEIRVTCRIFENFGSSFALLFILLAVLVCYATIGRIIDEQRRLVGTTKALGFRKGEIFIKYFVFGMAGGILGVALGLTLCYFLLEGLTMSASSKVFMMGSIPRVFGIVPALLATLIALVISAAAAYVACSKLLAEPAVSLMSGAVPVSFLKKKKGGNKSRSLYTNLILRNIVSDWKRVMITVVSIAGSCVLLVIGFSMRHSFGEVIRRQFARIICFDATVSMMPEAGEIELKELKELAEGEGAEALPFYSLNVVSRVGENRDAVQLFCAEPEAIAEYYTLKDMADRTDLKVPEEGVVVFNRFAETYGLKEGDTLSLMDDSGRYHEVFIGGIYVNYAGRTMFMSSGYAKKVFGDSVKENALAVRYQKADRVQLEGKMRGAEGFLGITEMSQLRKRYESTVALMNLIVITATIMAAIMAAVVLLNLVRIQLNQKKREMTIMRVNGFSVKETIAYILRENILTTFAGIALGLIVGNFAARFNLQTIERLELMMVRDFMPMPNLYSALITFLFAAIVNVLTLRKIRKLNLVDAN